MCVGEAVLLMQMFPHLPYFRAVALSEAAMITRMPDQPTYRGEIPTSHSVVVKGQRIIQ